MAPASTIFQDDYDATCEPEHIHSANKRQNRILDTNYKAADLREIIKNVFQQLKTVRNLMEPYDTLKHQK
jgi:hypothetical protein